MGQLIHCSQCNGLQDVQYMSLVSGMWHCNVCTERVLYYEERAAQREPQWMVRRRTQGMPAKDMTYRH